MKLKNLLVTAIATLVFVPAVGKTAHASVWHWGMPKVLIGHWYVPHDSLGSTMTNGKNYSHFYSNDPGFLNNTKYKYLGRHIYKVNGYEPIYSHKRYSTYFKWYNKNHISNALPTKHHFDWKMGTLYRK